MTEKQILLGARLMTPSLRELMLALHTPKSLDEASLALNETRRLAAYSIIVNARRLKRRDPLPASAIKIPASLLDALIKCVPYTLTQDQLRTVNEIVADLALPYPMRRIISGDVGCGKTLTFMIPALAVQKLGLRSVVLTPNTLLADQFVREVRAIYGDEAPVVAVTAATKSLALDGNPVLVGTTALLNRLKNAEPPSLLICDEQQKFSVSQKQALAQIGTNYLEATATPIPRTTALITHGAMDVSIIRQMPVVKNIATHIVQAAEIVRLYSHTKRVIEAGGQVAIVYPLVDNPEKEKKSVTAAYQTWSQRFPGQVGMIHGAMKEAEKIEAISKLKDGTHNIAIVSTVIEIGLTLPALKSMVVVNAERHGTSTLHQLRGRVARHGGNGHFFLYLPDAISESTAQRLNLLERFSDGFSLSEYDAQMRGYGDLFDDAERQHGNSRSTVFYCADLRPEDLHQFSAH
jgi:ATP-dependent DNA helicase RecG